MISGGPLKGARYTEVSWEDLKKAARSYKQDARFNQYAKRRMSERALGKDQKKDSVDDGPPSFKKRCAEWVLWFYCKSKGKALIVFLIFMLTCILLSRPLFYVVIAKSISMAVRLALRRSVGLVVLLIDAILDEAAVNLEATLIAPPNMQSPNSQNTLPTYEIQQQQFMGNLLMYLLFTCVGLVLGRHLPGTHVYVRPAPPTHLRVARGTPAP